MTVMGGPQQVLYKPPSGQTDPRLQQLASGSGRACMTYTETLASVPVADQKGLAVRQFPLWEPGSEMSFFFIDVASLTNQVGPDERSDAIKLANLMCSSKYLSNMSAPAQAGGSPQYLLLPRPTAYATLVAQGYTRYADFRSMINAAKNPVVLLAGSGIRTWYGNSNLKDTIRGGITKLPSEVPSETVPPK
jgi:thiamine pyridinylase